ncbi:MAG: CBS domain-containing protein [Phycisphaeraceae bacterium]
MQARDFMTEAVYCCTPETSLRDVARTMAERDVGCLPVVSDQDSRKLIGMLTDRDIVTRTLAQDRNPWELSAGDCMTGEIFTVHPDTSEEELCELMEQKQVRRVAVVDDQNICHGIVSQADIARKASEHETATVLRDISRAKAS